MRFLILLLYFLFLPKVTNQISDIRLLGSPSETPNAGRVQVYDSGEWKDVCHSGNISGSSDWSIKEAMVACRQIGYPGTAMSRKGGFGNGDSRGIDDFDCDGDETNLSQCGSPEDEKACSSNNDASVVCTVPGYLGCFVDNSNRILPDATLHNNSMTIQMCRDFCNSQTPTMRYAGVFYIRECFCGVESRDYTRLGRRGDSECNLSCGGNQNEICGGAWRLSVYDLLGGKCADPSPKHGSTIERDFSFGKWVTFACDEGYELIGETTLQCALGDTPDNCTWSEEPPLCQHIPVPTTPSPTTSNTLKPSTSTSSLKEPITGVSPWSPNNKPSQEPMTSASSVTGTTSPSNKPQENNLSIGETIAFTIGGFVVALLFILVICFVFKSRARRNQQMELNRVNSGTTDPSKKNRLTLESNYTDLNISDMNPLDKTYQSLKRPQEDQDKVATMSYENTAFGSSNENIGQLEYSEVEDLETQIPMTGIENTDTEYEYAKPMKEKRASVPSVPDIKNTYFDPTTSVPKFDQTHHNFSGETKEIHSYINAPQQKSHSYINVK